MLGLVAFSATRRTKEIGIRKILGANLPKIIFLLSKDVLLLVVLSSLIVIPLSWVITQWLQNFAYRMLLDYVIYFIVTFVALAFVFLTILLQSYRMARANPVDSLKYE